MPANLTRPFISILGGLGLAMAPLTAGAAQEAQLQEPQLQEPPAQEAPSPAPQAPPEASEESLAMIEQMGEVIAALDEDAERTGNNWQLTVDDTMLLVVTDASAGRMRVMTPIAQAEVLPAEAMERLLQANFDTALDARYAIANGLVWASFIHPLDTLTVRDFASGLLQTKSLSDTFGTTFSSGTLNYGGGDSGAIIEQQIEELLEQLENRQRETA